MITSTTELLNEITSITTSPSSRLLTKQSTLSAYIQKQRKEFALRYASIQSWFLRCSWAEKVATVKELLHELRRIDSLSLILNTLLATSSKTTIYGECQYYTNFIYDKTLKDHNRSLPMKSFKKTQHADIEWFSTLEEDYQQVLIIIGLLRLGGGAVMHHVFEEGRRLYEEKLTDTEQSLYNNILQLRPARLDTVPQSGTTNEGTDATPTITSSIASNPIEQKSSRNLNIKPNNMEELLKKNPKDPFVQRVEKRRRAWDVLITKYRLQVENVASTSRGKSDTSSVRSKSSKGGRSTKSGKSSKSSKKSKKGGTGGEEELDWIQLLPIWIVKKIFNYLDNTTLKKIKSVNKYWSYVVNDLRKEQKTRKFLDKFISKAEVILVNNHDDEDFHDQNHLKKNVFRFGPCHLFLKNVTYAINDFMKKTISTAAAVAVEEESSKLKDVKRRPLKVRMQNLWERGATAAKVKLLLKQPLTQKCLAITAANQTPENYLLPVQHIEYFPRNWQKCEPSLYKIPSCVVNELGFTELGHQVPFSDTSSASGWDDVSEHQIKKGHIFIREAQDGMSKNSQLNDQMSK